MAKALIGIIWAFNQQDLYTQKSVNLRLPDIEALRKPSRMISDVHAINANKSQLSLFYLD